MKIRSGEVRQYVRYCKRCDGRYITTAKTSKICENCSLSRNKGKNLKRKYSFDMRTLGKNYGVGK